MMVRLMKEDQAGKSEEELADCFRVFDKYARAHTVYTNRLCVRVCVCVFCFGGFVATSPLLDLYIHAHFVVVVCAGTATVTSTEKSLPLSSAAPARPSQRRRSMSC